MKDLAYHPSLNWHYDGLPALQARANYSEKAEQASDTAYEMIKGINSSAAIQFVDILREIKKNTDVRRYCHRVMHAIRKDIDNLERLVG